MYEVVKLSPDVLNDLHVGRVPVVPNSKTGADPNFCANPSNSPNPNPTGFSTIPNSPNVRLVYRVSPAMSLEPPPWRRWLLRNRPHERLARGNDLQM
jgi:hypothetical protein